MAFHGPAADVERVGDVGLGEVAVVTEHEHFSLSLREGTQCDQHLLTSLCSHRLLFGAGRMPSSVFGLKVEPLVGNGVMTVGRAGCVDDRASKICQRLVRFTQPVPLAVHGDEGVLHDLFGLAAVAHEQGGASRTSEV